MYYLVCMSVSVSVRFWPLFIDHITVFDHLEVKPILQSDEEKELAWRHREEQRKLDVKNIFEAFVKNAFYLQCIRVL